MKGLRFRLLVLVLALGICFAVHAQDDADADTLEADFAITTVEAQQRAVTELQSQSDALRTSGDLVQAARTLNRLGRLQIRMFALDKAVLTSNEPRHRRTKQPDPKPPIDNLTALP